jgi:hypothetical protein
MVGADELDLVRVVEMVDRKVGTKVHTRLASTIQSPSTRFRLHSATTSRRACSHTSETWSWKASPTFSSSGLNSAFSSDGGPALDSDIAIVPAGSASKVVYYSTILTSQSLKVAALLDSDSAGDQVC